ncbi:MAG TPA: hypothetical protein VFX25_19295 [Streptosporangiaceae bacterium]|nr:hypothetical protein [Streptosporangiaceae bacterium]
MTSITRSAVISAPADVVWQTIAHQFDRIGEWATVIPSSGPSARRPDDVEAPVCGRVCQDLDHYVRETRRLTAQAAPARQARAATQAALTIAAIVRASPRRR